MKTHWKKTIDKDWIGTYVLPEGSPIDVVIKSILHEEVKIKGVKEWHRVAYFEKNEHFDKPMLLNPTNCLRIEKLTGTPYIEDWKDINLKVTLCQEMDKAFGGGKDWALRISKVAPKKQSQLTPLTASMIDKAVGFINSGKSMSDLRKFYSFGNDIELLIKNKLNG